MHSREPGCPRRQHLHLEQLDERRGAEPQAVVLEERLLFERFQIGGEQSLRGFRAGSVLPLDKNNQVFTLAVSSVGNFSRRSAR